MIVSNEDFKKRFSDHGPKRKVALGQTINLKTDRLLTNEIINDNLPLNHHAVIHGYPYLN